MKIVDFLLLVHFWIRALFFCSPSISRNSMNWNSQVLIVLWNEIILKSLSFHRHFGSFQGFKFFKVEFGRQVLFQTSKNRSCYIVQIINIFCFVAIFCVNFNIVLTFNWHSFLTTLLKFNALIRFYYAWPAA